VAYAPETGQVWLVLARHVVCTMRRLATVRIPDRGQLAWRVRNAAMRWADRLAPVLDPEVERLESCYRLRPLWGSEVAPC